MANDKPPQGGSTSDGLSNDALLKTSNATIELSEAELGQVAGGGANTSVTANKQKGAQKSADAVDALVRS